MKRGPQPDGSYILDDSFQDENDEIKEKEEEIEKSKDAKV